MLPQGILRLGGVGPEQWQLAAVLPFSPRIKAKVPAVALQGPPGSGVSFSGLNFTQPHSLCSNYTGFLLPSLPSTLLGQSPWQSAPSSWKALALYYPRGSLPHLPKALLRYILRGPFSDQPSLNCGSPRSHLPRNPWHWCSHILTYDIIFHLLEVLNQLYQFLNYIMLLFMCFLSLGCKPCKGFPFSLFAGVPQVLQQ